MTVFHLKICAARDFFESTNFLMKTSKFLPFCQKYMRMYKIDY